MDTETTGSDRAAPLREAMIEELRGLNAVRTEAVAAALHRVPRHLFLPEESTEHAYAAERALVTKRNEQGVSLSSVSAARIQAFMLEQADLRSGMRVLEIGSGGYNAALISELVGPEGEVTSIDIDPDVVSRARRLLPAAGYDQVRTCVTDGAHGVPQYAPFDRVLVTVETADIAPAWVDQLTASGRIVVPLRLRGLTRSVSFERVSDQLVSRDYEVCGFVPMRGAAAHQEQLVVLHEDEDAHVGMRLDGWHVERSEPLRQALPEAGVQAWSQVTMGRGLPYDDLDLWLATVLDNYALLVASRAARDRGLVTSASPMGISALIDDEGTSFAYLTMRPTDQQRTVFEFGATAHGPRAEQTAQRLVARVQAWDRQVRGQRAHLRAHPSNAPETAMPRGRVIERPTHRFTISWPASQY
ncbi:protein-L-isoaspartate(D-aspartate) O-methyltransferase [Haloactinospora alba]|uniref:Protein-L-isoaspartate O-methyltransferase n=1 Tax=Haloactinospora alba TaxID=405555 RepID=A0A543NP08_9ACTN|nr:methyltransferase, FxLD system [Haloactinospora alba]TQN33506.1 protein-L-isoaspartate(D-aspartate) O-methyltransferase [Haloactinospora alba]